MIFEELVVMFTNIMGEYYSGVSITMETDLFQDLGCDSITLLMMGIAIEEKFKIKLSTESIDKCKTVGDIVNVITESLKAKK